MRVRSGVLKYMAVVAAALGVAFGVRFFSGRESVSYSIPSPAVVVARPANGAIEESLTLNGHVEARAMIPVIPLVSGIIVDYPARSGAVVAEGQVLAQIDPEPFRQQMLQARAAYTGYESSFVRVEGLYRAGAATRQEYDTLKSQRDAAKAQYDLAELQLGYASVSSPVAGTVLSAPLSAGSVAAAPQPVAVVADLSDLVVRLQVPEKYFSLFSQGRHGLEAQIVLPEEEGKGAIGRVDTIAPYINGGSKTFETVFRLEEGGENFSPGMFVRVRVVFNALEDAALLPITARKNDGTAYFLDSEGDDSQESSAQGRVAGTVRPLDLSEALCDDRWIAVPEEYRDRVFVVEGQEKVLAGQRVEGTLLELDWERRR